MISAIKQMLINNTSISACRFLTVDAYKDALPFYLKNGFYDTNKFYEDTGVNYEVLCTNDQYEITDDNMKMRYTNMTNNPKLFKVISNTFNVDVVNLKDKKVYTE